MNYSSNLHNDPDYTSHTNTPESKAEEPWRIHSAIIKPNNRRLYVLECKYMKLQFDGRWRENCIYVCVWCTWARQREQQTKWSSTMTLTQLMMLHLFCSLDTTAYQMWDGEAHTVSLLPLHWPRVYAMKCMINSWELYSQRKFNRTFLELDINHWSVFAQDEHATETKTS